LNPDKGGSIIFYLSDRDFAHVLKKNLAFLKKAKEYWASPQPLETGASIVI